MPEKGLWATGEIRFVGIATRTSPREADGRKSEGAIVLSKPGNAGGGKGPPFWRVCEGAEERRLAMSLATPQISRRSRASSYGKTKTLGRGSCCEAGRRAGCGKSARPVR